MLPRLAAERSLMEIITSDLSTDYRAAPLREIDTENQQAAHPLGGAIRARVAINFFVRTHTLTALRNHLIIHHVTRYLYR